MKRYGTLLIAFCATAALAGTDGFWNRKPYQSWTAAECQRLLTDSPWAKTFEDSRRIPARDRTREFGQFPNDQQQAGADVHNVSYTALLLSALPVRQAIMRLAQLRVADDPAHNPPELLVQAERLLSAEYPDRVVLRLVFSSNVPGEAEDWTLSWRQMSHEESRTHASLSARGANSIEPLEIVANPPEKGVDALLSRGATSFGQASPSMDFVFSREAVSSVAQASVFSFAVNSAVKRIHQTSSTSIEPISCGGAFCGMFGAKLNYRAKEMQFGGKTEY